MTLILTILKVRMGVVCYRGNSLVASFKPPDVPSDHEIDHDELEWQRWLADLMNPQCKY